jgi:hypothetical protein
LQRSVDSLLALRVREVTGLRHLLIEHPREVDDLQVQVRDGAIADQQDQQRQPRIRPLLEARERDRGCGENVQENADRGTV